MPFPFAYVCDLLELVEALVVRDDPLLPATLKKLRNEKILQWFSYHRHAFNANNTDDRLVLTIFNPENFHRGRDLGWLDSVSLEQIVRRVFNVPNVHLEELRRWRSEPLKGDLGACLRKVIDAMITSKHRRVMPGRSSELSVETIYKDLQRISLHDRTSEESDQIIEIFRRLFAPLESKVAKWLVRLILQDFGPVGIPETFDLSGNHYKLPRCLNVTALVIPSAPIQHGPGLLSFGSSLRENDEQPYLPTPWKHRKHPESLSEGAPASALSLRGISTFEYSLITKTYPLPRLPVKEPASENSVHPATTKTFVRAASNCSSILEGVKKLNDCPITPPESSPRVVLGAITNMPASTNTLPKINQTSKIISILSQAIFASSTAQPPFSTSTTHNTKSDSALKAVSSLKPVSSTQTTPQFSQNSKNNSSSSSIAHSLSQENPGVLPKSTSAARASRSNVSKCKSGNCRLTSTSCPLANCILLLSPCLANKSKIIDPLLAWHGSRTVTSPRGFLKHNLSPQKIFRNLILVDMYRHEQTAKFLNWVKSVSRNRDKAEKRQVVEVFDWRILEYIGKKDQGKVYDYDVWKRCAVTSLDI